MVLHHATNHHRDLLVSTSAILFGPEWQRPLARILGHYHPEGQRDDGIDDRLVRRWTSGEREIPDWVMAALAHIVDARETELRSMGTRLRSRGPARSFHTDGFLAPEIDQVRIAVRSAPEYKAWFAYVDDLNRLGFEMLRSHQVSLDDRRGLSISILFVRIHQSFQAAVLLIERGIVPDARTILRSAVESAIALIALAADESFVDRLVAADRKHKLTIARMCLEDPDYRATHSAEMIAQLERTVAEMEALKGELDKAPASIKWDQVAKRYCKDLYNLLYRSLSADGTHTTPDTMNRYLETDDVQITGLKLGPDASNLAEMVDTILNACLAFLWAAQAFADVFDQARSSARIKTLLARFRELSGTG